MSAERRIESVVFTPTGERRPPRRGEWFLCEPLSTGFMQSNSGLASDRDIYAREVFYAEPESEPTDLWKMARDWFNCEHYDAFSLSSSKFAERLICALISQIEAQKKEIAKVDRGIEVQRQGDRIDALRRRVDDLEGFPRGQQP